MSIITYVKLCFMIWVKVKPGHSLCLPWPQMKRIRRRARHSPPLPFLKQLIPGHMSSECRFRDFRPRVSFDIHHHHLTSAEVSVTSSARLLGVVSSFSIEKRVHWIPTICIFSIDPRVPCFQNLKSLPASGPSPPAVGATLEHPGDHLSRGWSVPALV